MVGRQSRLDKDLAPLWPAARAPRDLAQKLEAALARPKVREVDADVGVDHPHQRHVGEVEPFRDHLGAEQHVHVAGTHAVEDLGVGPLATRGIHVHARDARRRVPLREEALHLLRSEAALPERPATAAGAESLRRFGVQAIVAHQALRRAVIRERDAAIGACRDVAAVAALHRARVAAPVQQEDALLAGREALGERALEWRTDDRLKVARTDRGARGVAAQRAQVHDLHLRQLRASHTLGEREQPILARRRVDPAFEARRGAAQHRHRAFLVRPHDGDLAGVVPRRLALLVAGFVLLVDDDRAEVRERREDRRPRANGDLLLPPLEREPRVVALAVAERRVEHGHAVAKDGPEAVHGLRSERDLRHEHDRRPALPLDHLPQQLDVDKRLSAAGDAVQQAHLARRRACERVDRVTLGRRGLVPGGRRRGSQGEGIARDGLAGDRHQAALRKRRQHRRRERQPLREMLGRAAPA